MPLASRWRGVLAALLLTLTSAAAVATAPAAYALGTGSACVFNAPAGAGGLGHVGWGFRIDQSDNWIYGATENPTGVPAIEVGNNIPGWLQWAYGTKAPLGAWHSDSSVHTKAQMIADFQNGNYWNRWPDSNLNGPTPPKPYYTRYKCFTVTNSAVTAAKNAITHVEQEGDLQVGFPNETYRLNGWNCMNHAFYILSAYNASMSNPSDHPSDWAPNSWYDQLPGTSTAMGGHPYQVTGTDGSLALQSQPHVNNVKGWVSEGATVIVMCQTKYGDQADGATQYGRPFTTWDMLVDGSWVYDWYMNTPTVATNGYSPGIAACPGG